MVITDLSPQRKKGRLNLIVDNEFYSGIDELSVIKYSLSVGKEIDSEKLKEIVLESESRSAFERTIDILSCPKTEHEVREKLKKYGYSDEVILLAINKAKAYNYLDDLQIANLVIESKKNKSKLEIKNALIKKGIKSSIIDEALKSVSDESEYLAAKQLASKYLKNKERTKETFQKLYGYLSRKGFGEVAAKVVGEERKGVEDDWD